MLVAAAPAAAITYGTPDTTGLYPNVGSIVVQRTNGTYAQFCSGTLIGPGVFLTAAHCTSYLEERDLEARTFITFSPSLEGAVLIPVTELVTYEGYNRRQSDPGDIAVVLFDAALTPEGLEPAALPTLGYLDGLDLRGATFTAVGYGSLERTNGGGQPVYGDSPLRMYAFSGFNALNKAYLRLSQNPATGNGGTCYGDSGGPNFLGDTLVAITITGDAICRATNTVYRLDTREVRDFLGQFEGVVLP
ncbi:MAG: trypsin-like serine protease [Actinobacteria bacterium]|nr:trypsin-like serine protease [Actinomycetota bacterium]